MSYEYDPNNYRIRRTSVLQNSVTEYTYDNNGSVTYQKETVGTNVTTRSYAYFDGKIIGFYINDKKYYTVTDMLGTVVDVYAEDGTEVWAMDYTSFGMKGGEKVAKIQFEAMFTGKDMDCETGLTYHWNRWRGEEGYNWISEDSARDGTNWYGYAGQNPLIFIDSDGLSPKSALKLIANNREIIHRAAEFYQVDPMGIASVIFQEKLNGIFADAKDGIAYMIDGGINENSPITRSYGLAEMQLDRAAELLGIDINESGNKEYIYETLMNDNSSIALIALNISDNESKLGIELTGSKAGFAHNMGWKRYQDYLNNVNNPPNDSVAKRSEDYQKAINDALTGKINPIPDSKRNEKENSAPVD